MWEFSEARSSVIWAKKLCFAIWTRGLTDGLLSLFFCADCLFYVFYLYLLYSTILLSLLTPYFILHGMFFLPIVLMTSSHRMEEFLNLLSVSITLRWWPGLIRVPCVPESFLLTLTFFFILHQHANFGLNYAAVWCLFHEMDCLYVSLFNSFTYIYHTLTRDPHPGGSAPKKFRNFGGSAPA